MLVVNDGLLLLDAFFDFLLDILNPFLCIFLVSDLDVPNSFDVVYHSFLVKELYWFNLVDLSFFD